MPFWTRAVEGIKGGFGFAKSSSTTSSPQFLFGQPIILPEDLVYNSRTLRSPTAIVHLEYDPRKLEAKPSEEWTRFVCISDTHTQTFEVPDGDVLLHSGDLTHTGKLTEFEKTMKWICGLPHPVKIVIAGNHDLSLHEGWYDVNFMKWNQQKQDIGKIKDLLKGRYATSRGVVYLQDEEYSFQTKKGGRTWSVYGSPWSPWFHEWAFNYERENGKGMSFSKLHSARTDHPSTELVAKYPKTDILLTHGPPSGIFDETCSGDLAGCEDLRNRLEELQPRLHVFGHIHEAHGAHIHPWVLNKDGKHELPVVQVDQADEDKPVDQEQPVEGMEVDEDEIHRTVFANAAVFTLQGKGARKHRTTGPRLYPPTGGPGFQPIVVDLKD